jgi:hypothetical protein
VDATSAQHHIVASRPINDLPAEAAWLPCRVRAGDLGPYPAQTARGYHRTDGSVFARFTRDVAWWIGLDQRATFLAAKAGREGSATEVLPEIPLSTMVSGRRSSTRTRRQSGQLAALDIAGVAQDVNTSFADGTDKPSTTNV